MLASLAEQRENQEESFFEAISKNIGVSHEKVCEALGFDMKREETARKVQ